MRPALFTILSLFALTLTLPAQDKPASSGFKEEKDLYYHSEEFLSKADDYTKEVAKLDLLIPEGKKNFATLVWFHGGGLTGGKRDFPRDLKRDDIALVGVGYRCSPDAEHPAYLEDAAAAVAWVFKNIEKYGGDPKKIFVGGHSAGGYLSAMIGMDPRWLAAYGISNKQLAGIIPVSGQMTTHFTVKKLRGDTGDQFRPIIDEFAPMYYVAPDLPPICLMLGDRRIEFKSRVEENEFMAASLKSVGHKDTYFYELEGRDHGTVTHGMKPFVWQFMREIMRRINAEQTTKSDS